MEHSGPCVDFDRRYTYHRLHSVSGEFPLSENSLSGSLGYVTAPRQKANKRILFLKSDEFTRMVPAMRLISGVGVEVVARPGLKAAYTCRWIVGR